MPTFLVAVATVLVGQTPATATEVSHYEKWRAVAAKEFFVGDALMALCRTLTPEEQAAIKRNPHLTGAAQVFVNPMGRKAMFGRGKFPVGSAIVKRKKDDHGNVLGATVMIKRAKGFNPKVGDWEFATLDASGARYTSRGRLETCATCHVKVPHSDFTFRSYLPDRSK